MQYFQALLLKEFESVNSTQMRVRSFQFNYAITFYTYISRAFCCTAATSVQCIQEQNKVRDEHKLKPTNQVAQMLQLVNSDKVRKANYATITHQAKDRLAVASHHCSVLFVRYFMFQYFNLLCCPHHHPQCNPYILG